MRFLVSTWYFGIRIRVATLRGKTKKLIQYILNLEKKTFI